MIHEQTKLNLKALPLATDPLQNVINMCVITNHHIELRYLTKTLHKAGK
jgi:hypothetical protein